MAERAGQSAQTNELLPPARLKVRTGARRSDTLTNIAMAAFIIATLWLGRQIFVPIAIAVLLSFVLAPPVLLLRKWGVPRTLSVLLVALISFGILVGLGTILTRQMTDLAYDLPRYQSTISQKAEALRDAARASRLVEQATETVRGIGEKFTFKRPEENKPGTNPQNAPAPEPVPVEVQQPSAGPVEILRTVAATILEPLATVGIVAVFIVFILIQREDLRDRMIRLAGSGDLHRTTIAIDDAASRLSRFFLVQFLLNATFGLVVGIGLALIGVPSPMLWGLLAAIMRFVPYIGSIVAAIGPTVLAAAADPGWTMVIMTVALFLILEPLIGQVVEPLVYGHSTGLSPIAVVAAATFWTWLWGPVGLLLSTPLTVCVVVLGRHVERLGFLDIILSDAPALSAPESFYQRLLASDPSEASEQAADYLRTHRLVAFYDDIVMQSLAMAQADLRRGLLDEDHQAGLRDTLCEVIDDLDDAELEPKQAGRTDGEKPAEDAASSLPILGPGDLAAEFGGETAVLCIGVRNALDDAGAAILAQLLRKHGLGAQKAEAQILAPGRSLRLPTDGVAIVCLSAFDADLSTAQMRYAARRIRRRFPQALLVACFWMLDDAQDRATAPCASAGANICAPKPSKALSACLAAARRKPDTEGEIAQAATKGAA